MYGWGLEEDDADENGEYHRIDHIVDTGYSIKLLVDLDVRQVVKGLLLD